ncbi:SH3 domain-containing protein [Mesobacillus foraminis]|uniref:SH3 domain-containing protein n=1 Tax=Mesobacillus foraminis TaxID=279826 RepID=UPI00399FB401
MKVFIRAIALFTLLLSLSAFPMDMNTGKASAAPYSGKVTANGLNVRAKASTSSKVVGWFQKGDVIQIYSASKGWGETRFKNKKAFVSLKYIKKISVVKYTGTVTSNGLNVREKASASSKVVGWLRKGSVIQIYSTGKGWGEIRLNNKKAYVSLKYIKLSPVMFFKRDKAKTYTYTVYGEKRVYKYQSSSTFGTPYQWNKWIVEAEEPAVFYERESTGELQTASENHEGKLGSPTILLKYPIYLGQTWKPNPKNHSFTVTSTAKTVKTPAGTFKNVIEVKSTGLDSIYYYAKNIGLIKSIEKGKTTQELQRISKR